MKYLTIFLVVIAFLSAGCEAARQVKKDFKSGFRTVKKDAKEGTKEGYNEFKSDVKKSYEGEKSADD